MNEPESNLISNRLRSALFPPQPLRKPDARARKAATVAETLLIFFMSPGWLRQRQGKGLGQKAGKGKRNLCSSPSDKGQSEG